MIRDPLPAPVFRRAGSHEAGDLMHLEREANLLSLRHVFPPTQFPYPAADVQRRWATLLRDDAVTVAVAEDAVGLTAVVAFDTAGRLRHLAVRPDLWGTGLARAAIAWAVEHGQVTHLWALEDNHRALQVYAHLGWVRTGRRATSEFPPHPIEIELARTV